MNKSILLTFDVEEFDVPLIYGCNIAMQEQLEVGKKGLDTLMPVINQQNIACTFFTTANFAVHYPDAIKALSIKHEVASHSYYHTAFKTEDLLLSKQKLEGVIEKEITGFRMPRMQNVDVLELNKAGYKYDSSINPTFIPGRYNNYSKPRTAFVETNVIRVPSSVTANLRIPLFWLAFKNMPYAIFKSLALQTLKKDGYLCLYFHPWEFIDIEGYNLPTHSTRYCKAILLERLNQLMNDLKKEGDFITMNEFVRNWKTKEIAHG